MLVQPHERDTKYVAVIMALIQVHIGGNEQYVKHTTELWSS